MFYTIPIVENYIWSYSQDLVHGVSRGKYFTAKYTLLFNVISTFGKCGNYNLGQLIETVQVEHIHMMKEEGASLPIVSEDDEKQVTTYF